ncbi:MAG: endo,4-beta-xylanase [Solirubrobacteraceae bacterium]|jgi:endo-1,4-beta-xylanase|nr:endo,4-beta-xylanase [Solirubrobacteraceae bacterium]
MAAMFALVVFTAWYFARGGGDAKPLPGPALRELAKKRGIEIGTAVRGDVLKRNRAYRQLVAAQFSTVTPENEMKWDAVEPSRGDFQFGPADDIVSRARDAHQKVRGHTLVWHAQVPGWVKDLSAGELRQAMREHIRREMEHFSKDVGVWDVVNEPITDQGGLRESVFERRLGPGFIEDAFRTARAADANAKLYLNEIGAEGINPKSNRLYQVVSGLKAQGVPIDGVSFQTHANLNGLPADMVDNMRRFKALGLDVAITEADVALKVPPTAGDLQAQAGIYTQIVRNCLAVDCRSLTFWGFTDGRSWISETQAGMGAATLLDASLRPKPAFAAVQQALSG